MGNRLRARIQEKYKKAVGKAAFSRSPCARRDARSGASRRLQGCFPLLDLLHYDVVAPVRIGDRVIRIDDADRIFPSGGSRHGFVDAEVGVRVGRHRFGYCRGAQQLGFGGAVVREIEEHPEGTGRGGGAYILHLEVAVERFPGETRRESPEGAGEVGLFGG